MKRMILTGTMLLTAALLSGSEFITASAPGDFIGGGKASISNGETTVSGRAVLYSKRKLDIDTKKRYRLSGEFKAGAGSRNGDYFRFGVYPATNNSQIQAVHINIVPGTDTELAADCNAADTVIKLKDASKWKSGPLCVAAFDTDPSGRLSDLPNFNVSKTGAKSLVNKNGVWELTLKHPCGKNFPAGTTVREHRAGWSVIYAGTPRQLLTPEWAKIEVIIEPGEVPSASIRNWWKGTAKAGLVVESAGNNHPSRFSRRISFPPGVRRFIFLISPFWCKDFSYFLKRRG